MKKFAKTVVGTALGVGAGLFAAGAIAYEAVLNMKLHDFVMKTGFFNNPEEDKFWAENELYHNGFKWYEEIKPELVSVDSRLAREAFADIIPAKEETHKWAVVIHGYSGTPAVMAHYAWKYSEAGYNVILPHMVGHDNDTTVHNEYYCSMGYYDKEFILDWINWIVAKDAEAEIIMHGVSMGSATTMMVTGEDIPDNVIAAIADCGFTSCWDEFASQFKEMFNIPSFPLLNIANVYSKLRGNFDFKECSPLNAVARSKTPTMFVHGEDDTFVPYRFMQPLYDACTAEKEMLSVPGSFHANAVFVDNERYWNTVFEFIAKHTEIAE